MSFLGSLDQIRDNFIRHLWRAMLVGQSGIKDDNFISKGLSSLGIGHRLFECIMTSVTFHKYVVNDGGHKTMVKAGISIT